MDLARIPRAVHVLPAGRRIMLPGGPQAVLMLHGWTGWPGRLAYLADRLNEQGFAVSVPRLPGHGTSMSDMLRTRAGDWLRRSVDEYLDLREEYDQVHLAGTSMGGILAAIIAAEYEVDRLALLAPAFINRNALIKLTPLLRWVLRRVRGGWREEEEQDPGAIELGREYGTHNYLRLVAELYRLQRLGRRMLPRLHSETLVVVSRADRSVPPEVAAYVEQRAHARALHTVVVDRSNHQIAQHLDRELVATEVIDWFLREPVQSPGAAAGTRR